MRIAAEPTQSGTPPLRVTIVSPYATIGGAERWLLDVLDATARLDVDIVQLQSGAIESEFERRRIRYELLPTGGSGAQMVRAAMRLRRQLRDSNCEAVLANGLKAAIVGVVACRSLGIPVVWIKHDHFHDRIVGRVIARAVDHVIATSSQLIEPTPPRAATVVPPPRPTAPLLSRGAAREVLAARGVRLDDRPTFAMVGRIIDYKGIDDAIVALGTATSWQLVVIGDDDASQAGATDALRQLAEHEGVADRVHFTGHIDGAFSVLTAFDAVGQFPKLGHDSSGEGFGIAALEAAAAGVPVISTPNAPVLELLGGAHLVVPVASPTAIAEALTKVRELGPTAVSLAADLANEHPDASRVADTVAAVIARVAGRPGAGRTDGRPVSVITTVFNESRSIDAMVERLLPQLQPVDELIVVDGGSTDDTVERLQQWSARDPRLHAISSPGATIADGRNIAVDACRNEVVACTDAGCVATATWLAAFRSAFAEPDPPSLVTGTYEVIGDLPFQRAMATANYPVLDEAIRRGPLVRAYGRVFGTVFDPTLPTGRSMAFTRTAVREAGGFPETLSEVVIGQRIAMGGGRCDLSTEATVRWLQRPTWRSTAKMYWNYGYGDGVSGSTLLVARNLARASATVFVLLALSGVLGRTGRRLTLLGGMAYLSLPLVRSHRRRLDVKAVALVPLAMSTKDVAKAAGCATALAFRAWKVVDRRPRSATTIGGPSTALRDATP